MISRVKLIPSRLKDLRSQVRDIGEPLRSRAGIDAETIASSKVWRRIRRSSEHTLKFAVSKNLTAIR